MDMPRSSGILLHPSSLPGSEGIGTLGKEAFRFIDWLESAGQTLWQILPLGPTGYGNSPYASFSTFAGNPLLIDTETLVREGLLEQSEIRPAEKSAPASADEPVQSDEAAHTDRIDFGSLVKEKIPLLQKAAERFLDSLAPNNPADDSQHRAASYAEFKKKHKFWLDDYALFMSIKELYDKKAQEEKLDGRLWNNYWPRSLALREEDGLAQWKRRNKKNIEIQKAVQFFFFDQWMRLKAYANAKGISIIGDIPIFVALDSADVWAHKNLFQLNAHAVPKAVAGVPPDYFSETGQLWGNPLYDWKAMKKDDYAWWAQRIRHSLTLVDYVRIDHFRGFEAYWAVPFGEKTAVNGTWLAGPRSAFFSAIEKKLGKVNLIAEDLGVITDGVRSLLNEFGFPGMKVLQFAFDANEAGGEGCTNPFLPHMYDKNCIVYTGTHDNDTTQGWLNRASEHERAFVSGYLSRAVPGVQLKDEQLCSALISAAFFSVAAFAVIPMQDLFALGSEARMNMPSTSGETNWAWRMDGDFFDSEKAQYLKHLSRLSGRNVKEKRN